LAEHGLFGLLALILLLVIPIRNLSRARSPADKAMVAAMAGWGLLYLLVNAMRLAAPSFLLGLTCVSFLSEENGRLLLRQRFKLLIARSQRALRLRDAYRQPEAG
jgi:uncharacterized membrane protein YjjB (DUF3815 family)